MRAVAGVVVLAALALAGCTTSSAEPPSLPSLSPAASPSAAPSPTPTGKDAPTPEGAAAFARFFYSQIEQAFAQKDPTLVARLSQPDCKSCQQFVASLTRLRDKNERVEGFHIQIGTAVAPAVSDPSVARVDVIWGYGGARRYDSSGKLIREEKPARGIEDQVDLVRRGGAWRVAEITRIRVSG
jgi:hypothetical protein